jgi:hypothetical protein
MVPLPNACVSTTTATTWVPFCSWDCVVFYERATKSWSYPGANTGFVWSPWLPGPFVVTAIPEWVWKHPRRLIEVDLDGANRLLLTDPTVMLPSMVVQRFRYVIVPE